MFDCRVICISIPSSTNWVTFDAAAFRSPTSEVQNNAKGARTIDHFRMEMSRETPNLWRGSLLADSKLKSNNHLHSAAVCSCENACITGSRVSIGHAAWRAKCTREYQNQKNTWRHDKATNFRWSLLHEVQTEISKGFFRTCAQLVWLVPLKLFATYSSKLHTSVLWPCGPVLQHALAKSHWTLQPVKVGIEMIEMNPTKARLKVLKARMATYGNTNWV